MPTAIWKADEKIHALLREVADAHHPHLEEARILVLLRDHGARRRGRDVLGTAAKASPKDKALLGEEVDFIVTLSAEHWHEMEYRERRALLDHELCHCGRDEIEKKVRDPETGRKTTVTVYNWAMRGHDVEEFTAILGRHGAWRPELEDFARAARQLELFERPDSYEGSARADEDVEAKLDRLLEGVPGVQKNVTITAAVAPTLREASRRMKAAAGA